jgi:hypothetical protein
MSPLDIMKEKKRRRTFIPRRERERERMRKGGDGPVLLLLLTTKLYPTYSQLSKSWREKIYSFQTLTTKKYHPPSQLLRVSVGNVSTESASKDIKQRFFKSTV